MARRGSLGIAGRFKSSLLKAIDPILALASAALIGYGLYLRLKPLESVGPLPGDLYSWKALAGAYSFGEPSFLLWLAASMGGAAAASLAPVALWLIAAIAAGAAAIVFTGSLVAALVAVSLLSLSTIALQATAAGFTAWDTPSLATLSVLALALAMSARTGREVYAAVAGVVAGLSSTYWDSYPIAVLVVSTYSILELARGSTLAALVSSLALTAALAVSPGAGVASLLLGPGVVALAALSLSIAAHLRALRPGLALGVWALLAAFAYYFLLLASGLVAEPDLARGLLGLDPVATLALPAEGGAGAGALLRDLGVWVVLSAAASAWLAYKLVQGKISWDVVAGAPLAVGLVAVFALAAEVSSSLAPSAVALTALTSPMAVRVFRELGLSGDELGLVIAVGAALGLVITGAYLASQDLDRVQLMVPILAGGQALVDAEDAEEPEPYFLWEEVASVIKESGARKVYVWPSYGNIIEALAGVESTSLDDGYNELFNALAVLTGTEGEASAIISRYEGLAPGEAVVVVREVFLGRYDAQNGVVVLYPRPIVVQSLGTRFFVVQGVADLAHLYTALAFTGRIEEGVSPFDSGWQSEYSIQGFTTVMFPGLLGNPSDNVARARETLLVRLILDSVFKLASDGELLRGCGFIPETAVFVPGAFVAMPGRTVVQPLFIVTDTERFEPLRIVMTCPQIISDTGLIVEFTAEVIGVYLWRG